MFEGLQEWTAGLAEPVQWLGVMLISAIPYVESYLGAAVGVVAGVNPIIAIVVAVIGNVISMLAFVLGADRVRNRVARDPKPLSKRQGRLKRNLDRWGVPGVSLLGQTVLPSQITSAALVGFGADRNAVILWQVISIVLWGVAFGLLAVGGLSLTA